MLGTGGVSCKGHVVSSAPGDRDIICIPTIVVSRSTHLGSDDWCGLSSLIVIELVAISCGVTHLRRRTYTRPPGLQLYLPAVQW